MQSLQAVQASVFGNEPLDQAPAEAAGSFPPFSLESAYLWCLYLGSQFALFSIFLDRLNHQMFYCFFCLSHGKERGKKSQGNKKNTSSQEKEKANQILPLKQRSQSSFISTFNSHWDFPICWRWKVHWILAEVQVLKHLLYFFKQNLYPQLYGRQIKEQADEACPIQGREFASTVINFRGELFSLSFSCIVVLKTFKANFLVRTVREEGDIAGLFSSLLHFASFCFQHLESFLMTPSLSNCDIKVFCQSVTSHQIGLLCARRSTDLLSKVCSSLCCVLNLVFLHLRTTSPTCHASDSGEPQQHSRNQRLGKPN